MPHYDYYCPANGKTVEVMHGMSERLTTWGEVRRRAGLYPDGTGDKEPVEKLISGGYVMKKRSGGGQAASSCSKSSCSGCSGC